ncbi:hypothetical protein FHG87_023218 [Trinorchestia longiramus]|nr:hypothetical protein FHG87_023218 [Trinorchestia longiramus]
MFGMNVMAWNGGDLEKLEVLQNRVGHLVLGTPKWMAAEALIGALGWSPFSERMVKAVLNYKVRIERMENKREVGENQWNARCVEEDSGMRYLVGLDEECNITVVDAMKNFLVHAWNK